MPCAPASRQVRAARRMSGSSPPRELRSTAILLRLTLRPVTYGRISQPEARRLRSRRHDGPVPVRAGGEARPALGAGFRTGPGRRFGAPPGPASTPPGTPPPPAATTTTPTTEAPRTTPTQPPSPTPQRASPETHAE